ncbi:hypothetical protein M446_2885 [Methylobacterium sp. 4-46]|uniref:hypothetical protein n=1 Tax=unclassified Methylobacterium TaxID=2615210 RepID=UPI000152D289|nr:MULTISPECIES: hypothetical protein [Methylobacterium]ACA17306.1 hypothetical protein M446_2885 [Methylobacterium sp. 4-46]WFT83576.1 hypothetical protein QA634_14635 [Methylobacterium nodulans]
MSDETPTEPPRKPDKLELRIARLIQERIWDVSGHHPLGDTDAQTLAREIIALVTGELRVPTRDPS